MILFWIICSLMIVIALAFVLPPLLQADTNKNANATEVDRKAANVAIYRDQLEELKVDLVNGLVSQQQFDQDREDIERRLLEDTDTDQLIAKKALIKNRNTAYALGLAIPLIAVIFYVKVGSPPGTRTAAAMPTSAQAPAMVRSSFATTIHGKR